MKRYPNVLGFSVSHTTRNSRPGEQHGVQYYFVSDLEMRNAINNNEFLEHAYVHTHFYGTSYQAVKNIQTEGKVCILDIDVQGVQTVKKNSNFKAKYLFIAPPSVEELGRRLNNRSTETPEQLKIRLENARSEIEYGLVDGNFDMVIVNDDLNKTLEDIIVVLRQWYPSMQF
jgi:guanylate kinase